MPYSRRRMTIKTCFGCVFVKIPRRKSYSQNFVIFQRNVHLINFCAKYYSGHENDNILKISVNLFSLFFFRRFLEVRFLSPRQFILLAQIAYEVENVS